MINEADYKNTYRFLDEQGLELISLIKKELTDANKNASFKLINSLNYDIETKGDVFSLVVEYADTGKFLLSGRKPGSKYPPKIAIMKWLKQKRLVLRDDRKVNIKGEAYSKEEQLNSLAFLIQRKIARFGIKPFNFLKPYDTLKKSKEFALELEKNIAKDLEYIFIKEIKKEYR